MLSNPVLKREFLTSLRTLRAIGMAMTFLTSLAMLVILMWPAEGVYSLAAQSSHKLFTMLSMGFLGLVSLCAPSFTAVAITGEKEAETYDTLYDTMLRPDEIVFGKLIAGIGFVMVLIVCSLPMAGACLILGGVSIGDLLMVYLVVVCASILFGLLGLYCSAIFNSSYRSLILCYVFILAICGSTWVPAVITGGFTFTVHYTHLLRGFSPFAAMIAVVNPSAFVAEHGAAPQGLGGVADSPYSFLFFAAVMSVALLIMVLRQIAQPPQPKRRGNNMIVEDRMELIKRHVKFPFYLLDPRKRKRQFGAFLNVIAVKEMRAKAFARAVWIFRAIYILFIVSLLLVFTPLAQIHIIPMDTIIFTCISIPLAIIILISPVLTASAVTEERESGVFDMIRCTRVGAWTFVMGKVEVAWFFTALLLMSTFPTFFVLAFIGSGPGDMEHISKGINHVRPFNFQFAEGWKELIQVDSSFLMAMGASFMVLMVAMLFATVVGIAASSWSKRSSTATAITYGVVIAYAIGTLIPYFIADSLPAWIVDLSLTINPFAAAAKAVEAEAFPHQPALLWITHLKLIGGATAAILLMTMIRVWTLMRPQR